MELPSCTLRKWVEKHGHPDFTPKFVSPAMKGLIQHSKTGILIAGNKPMEYYLQWFNERILYQHVSGYCLPH